MELTNTNIYYLDESFTSDRATIVGGFYCQKDKIKTILNNFLDLKKKYGLVEEDVVKWHLDTETFEKLRKNGYSTDQLKMDVFRLIAGADIKLIVAKSWCGEKGNHINGWREALKWILQRCVYNAPKQCEYPRVQIVLDWLPKADVQTRQERLKAYFEVYSELFFHGDTDKHIDPLKEIDFFESMLVTSTHSSNMMQIADFVVGISAELFIWAFNDPKGKNTTELQQRVSKYIKIIKSKYDMDKKNNKIIAGHGIIVGEKDKPKIENILDAIEKS